MKKIFSLFVLLLSIVMLLTGCGNTLVETLKDKNIIGPSTTENDVDNMDYELLLENDKLQLHMNPDTTEFKVVNKVDKSVWYSGNKAREEDDGRALLYLEYISNGGITNRINSFEAGVKNGQYKIETEKDKVTVKYSIGNFTAQVLVPEVLSQERYNELINRFEDIFDQSKFRNFYTLFDKNEMQEDDVYVQDMLKKYPVLEKKAMYVVSQNVLTSPTVKKDFAAVLTTIQYSREDFDKDSENFADATTEVQEAGFNISLEFTLDDGDLLVTIPNDSVEMYDDFPLTNITLLKYFGSQSDADNGYFVLPDGSGSVMNSFNGKGDGHEFSTSIYGTGYSLSVGEKTNNYNDASLPVFGINNGKKGIFAEIIKGDSIADVVAYPGDDAEVAYVSPRFRFRETFISKLSSGAKESFSTIQKERFPGDMQVRYSFLSGADSTYNGMANIYRNRLFGNETAKASDISLTVEYIGMIQKQAQLFGIAYDKDVVMTTFNKVGEYAKSIKDSGINNLNIKLSGWFGSGYNHGSTNKIKPNKALGGLEGFNKLSSDLKKNGIKFWPDADIQYTADSGISSDKKAIRTIDKNIGATYSYNLASFNKSFETGSRRVNNLATVIEELNGVKAFAKENSLNSISLRSVGKAVNADFNEDNFIDQQTVMVKTANELETLKKNKTSFITSGSNAYVLKLADLCLDTPLTSNQYDITDYSIPFLQMVIRGNVNYAGNAVNLTGDVDNAVLLSAQTGANLYYVFAGENADEIVDSSFTNLFSIDYDYYKDSLVNTVKKYQSDFAVTAGQRIKSYTQISAGVTKTVFENGSISYVNTNNYKAKADGITLEAKSYIVKKG